MPVPLPKPEPRAGAAQTAGHAAAAERAEGGHFTEVVALLGDRVSGRGTFGEDPLDVGRRGDLRALFLTATLVSAPRSPPPPPGA